MGRFHQTLVVHVGSDYYTGRIEVVVESLGLAQELRREEDVVCAVLFTHGCSETHRNRGLYHHDGIRIHLHYQPDDRFHSGSVEEVLLRIVVGRSRNHHELRIAICSLRIKSRYKVQFLLGEIFLNVFILDRRLTTIYHLHLFRHDIHSHDAVLLRQESRHRQSHISCSCYCNLHLIPFTLNFLCHVERSRDIYNFVNIAILLNIPKSSASVLIQSLLQHHQCLAQVLLVKNVSQTYLVTARPRSRIESRAWSHHYGLSLI